MCEKRLCVELPPNLTKIISFQKTCQSANEVRQRADKLIKDGHFDPEAIWKCADGMTKRWQTLMEKAETRKAITTASFDFFTAAEQVSCRSNWL